MVKKRHMLVAVLALGGSLALQQYPAVASPFGAGVYGADVPYGSETSVAISLSGSVSMTLSSSGSYLTGSDSHTVTVTSTDVVGYDLYAKATTSTSMSNGTDTIAASNNSVPSSLATNTWGYNTTSSSSSFKGMTLSDASLKSATGPYKSGDNTTVTYGAKVDSTVPAGAYTVNVTYTAVGKS